MINGWTFKSLPHPPPGIEITSIKLTPLSDSYFSSGGRHDLWFMMKEMNGIVFGYLELDMIFQIFDECKKNTPAQIHEQVLKHDRNPPGAPRKINKRRRMRPVLVSDV